MKRELYRKVRLGLIAVLTLLLLGSACLAFRSFRQPDHTSKQLPVYQYTSLGWVDYQVVLLPNPFFPEKSADPGQAYLVPLTNYIQTHYTYSFSGQEKAEIQGQYNVTARLTAYIYKDVEGRQGSQRQKVKVWETANPLVPTTTFTAADSSIKVEKTVPVNLKQYVDFADRVAKEYRASVDEVDLVVSYDTDVTISTSHGQSQEKVSPALLIPLKGNTFMVDGKLQDQKEGTINASKAVPLPAIKTARIVYSTLAVLFALALIWVALRTTNKKEDPVERSLSKITRKYGDRVVAGQGKIPPLTGLSVLKLESFLDLVKVSDDTVQPILYEHVEEGIHSFYVIHEPVLYSWTLDYNSLEKQSDS